MSNISTFDELSHAISRNDITKIQSMIETGVNVNDIDVYRDNVLLDCVRKGHFPSKRAVEMLIQAGIDVNAQNRYGSTVLMWLLFKFSPFETIDIARLLLDNKANPNLQSGSGVTALFYAVDNSQFTLLDKVVQLLIDYKADVNINGRGKQTVLSMVVYRKSRDSTWTQTAIKVSERLINNGIIIDDRENYIVKTAINNINKTLLYRKINGFMWHGYRIHDDLIGFVINMFY